jgi:hypothetical protein
MYLFVKIKIGKPAHFIQNWFGTPIATEMLNLIGSRRLTD